MTTENTLFYIYLALSAIQVSKVTSSEARCYKHITYITALGSVCKCASVQHDARGADIEKSSEDQVPQCSLCMCRYSSGQVTMEAAGPQSSQIERLYRPV
jgi:hypothetical protein